MFLLLTWICIAHWVQDIYIYLFFIFYFIKNKISHIFITHTFLVRVIGCFPPFLSSFWQINFMAPPMVSLYNVHIFQNHDFLFITFLASQPNARLFPNTFTIQPYAQAPGESSNIEVPWNQVVHFLISSYWFCYKIMSSSIPMIIIANFQLGLLVNQV